jgi:hypothetical protein
MGVDVGAVAVGDAAAVLLVVGVVVAAPPPVEQAATRARANPPTTTVAGRRAVVAEFMVFLPRVLFRTTPRTRRNFRGLRPHLRHVRRCPT